MSKSMTHPVWFSRLFQKDTSEFGTKSLALFKSVSGQSFIPNRNVIIAKDVLWNGKAVKSFSLFQNAYSLNDFVTKTCTTPQERVFYEVITEECSQKPYFDIDYSRPIDGGGLELETVESYVSLIATAAESVARRICGVENSNSIVFSSCSDLKFSYHIIVNGIKLASHKEAKLFCEGVCAEILLRSPSGRGSISIIDRCIYKSTQQFRMAGCSKIGTNRIKTHRPDLSPSSSGPEKAAAKSFAVSSTTSNIKDKFRKKVSELDKVKLESKDFTDSLITYIDDCKYPGIGLKFVDLSEASKLYEHHDWRVNIQAMCVLANSFAESGGTEISINAELFTDHDTASKYLENPVIPARLGYSKWDHHTTAEEPDCLIDLRTVLKLFNFGDGSKTPPYSGEDVSMYVNAARAINIHIKELVDVSRKALVPARRLKLDKDGVPIIHEENAELDWDLAERICIEVSNFTTAAGFAFPFKLRDISGTMISLRRECPSMCMICDRVHENDNPYIALARDGKTAFFKCRRATDGGGRDFVAANLETSNWELYSEILKYIVSPEVDADLEFVSGTVEEDLPPSSSIATTVTNGSVAIIEIGKSLNSTRRYRRHRDTATSGGAGYGADEDYPSSLLKKKKSKKLGV